MATGTVRDHLRPLDPQVARNHEDGVLEVLEQTGTPTDYTTIRRAWRTAEDEIRSQRYSAAREAEELDTLQFMADAQLTTRLEARQAEIDKELVAELRPLEAEHAKAQQSEAMGVTEVSSDYQARLTRLQIREVRQARRATIAGIDAGVVLQADAESVSALAQEYLALNDEDLTPRILRAAEARLKALAGAEVKQKVTGGPGFLALLDIPERVKQWQAAREASSLSSRRAAFVAKFDAKKAQERDIAIAFGAKFGFRSAMQAQGQRDAHGDGRVGNPLSFVKR